MTTPTTSPINPDEIAWVLSHEVLPRSTRTYPAQVAMYLGRHFGPGGREPIVADVCAALRAMGFASVPFTFTVGRRSVTVPMFDVAAP